MEVLRSWTSIVGDSNVALSIETLLDRIKLSTLPIDKRDSLNCPIDEDLTIDDELIADESFPLDHRVSLSLLFHLVAPENLIICSKFIETGGLAYAISSLSSNHDDVRQLGYAILSRFYQQLESSLHFRNRELWLTFIDLLRVSIKEPNQQIPRVATFLLAESIPAILKPRHYLHDTMRAFMTKTGNFEGSSVANLLITMLKSTDETNGDKYGRFAMRCLARGCQTELDISLLHKHKLLDYLLPLTQSPLTKSEMKPAIYAIVESIVRLESGVTMLNRSYGLMTWITLECCSLNSESQETRQAFSKLITQLGSTVKNMTRDQETLVENKDIVEQLLIVMNLLPHN